MPGAQDYTSGLPAMTKRFVSQRLSLSVPSRKIALAVHAWGGGTTIRPTDQQETVIHRYTHTYIYIYIYRERERDKQKTNIYLYIYIYICVCVHVWVGGHSTLILALLPNSFGTRFQVPGPGTWCQVPSYLVLYQVTTAQTRCNQCLATQLSDFILFIIIMIIILHFPCVHVGPPG